MLFVESGKIQGSACVDAPGPQGADTQSSGCGGLAGAPGAKARSGPGSDSLPHPAGLLQDG